MGVMTFIFFLMFGLFSIVAAYAVLLCFMLGKINGITTCVFGSSCIGLIILANIVGTEGKVHAMIPVFLVIQSAILAKNKEEIFAYFEGLEG